MTSAANERGAGAARLGISAVPFGVIGRTHGVSGAQPEEMFAQALRDAWGSSSGQPPLFVLISPARKPFRGAAGAAADRLRPTVLHAMVGP